MSKRLVVVVVGVLTVVIAAAGCGSSSDSSGSTASVPALTKAELIKQGDAICTKSNTTLEKEANEFAKENDINTQKPTQAQKEEVITEVVAPRVRQQGEEIGELGVPSGDEKQVEAIVAAVETGADELEETPKLLTEGKSPLDKASKLAGAYGFKVCGEG